MKGEGDHGLIMSNSAKELCANVQVKPEFQDECDYFEYKDCKKELGLEDLPETAIIAENEMKFEDDWKMLEVEMCSDINVKHEEVIIKDEVGDITDIAAYGENRSIMLGTEMNICNPTAIILKEEYNADPSATSGENGATDALPSMITMADAKESSPHFCESLKTCQKPSILNSSFLNLPENIFTQAEKKQLFKCLRPACNFNTFNHRAFRRHQHSENQKNILKLIKCQHCGVSLKFKDLSRHTLSIHKDRTEKCGKCRQQVPTQLMNHHRCLRKIYKKYTCKLCAFVATQKISFIKHMKLHVRKKRLSNRSTRQQESQAKKPLTHRYNCNQCSYSTSSRAVFVRHTKYHSKLPTVKCEKCDYRSLKRIVDHHFSIEHCNVKFYNAKLYKCDLCPFSLSLRNRSVIEEHINRHTDDLLVEKCHIDDCHFKSFRYVVALHFTQKHGRDYTCRNCSYTTQRIEEYTKHCHGDNENSQPCGTKKEYFKCCVCNFSSGFQDALKQHMVEHAINANYLSCLYCSQRANNVQNLIAHSVQKHPEYNRKCPDACRIPEFLIRWHLPNCRKRHVKTYWCQECSYSTHNSTQFKSHCKSHLEVNTYTCQECSYSTSRSTQIKSHCKSHLKGVPIEQCPYCDYRSTSRALLSHIKLDHCKEVGITTRFKCTTCSYSNSGFSKFKKHCKSHFGDKSLRQCPLCDYKSNSEALGHHVKSVHIEHLERHMYKCKECSFSSLKKSALELHSQQHLMFNPLMQCPQCDYRSTSRALLSHLQRIHPEFTERSLYLKVYNCNLCSHSTHNLGNFKKHEKAHQNSNIIVQCPHCEFKSTKKALSSHIRGVHTLCGNAKNPKMEESAKICEKTLNISENTHVQDPEKIRNFTKNEIVK